MARLENFYFEAADVSSDCRRAREGLLISYQEWPGADEAPKKRWIEFLEIVGVANELRPVPSRFKRSGMPAFHWDSFVRDGNPTEGFDGHWCAEVGGAAFSNPYTDRQADGEAWRFPGQLEHSELQGIARESFCTLVFEHIREYGDHFFHFRVGKFDRSRREWDPVSLPTPLATFLRSNPWVAVITREGVAFRCPDKCWGARSRPARPPRFMERLPDVALNVLESGDVAELVLGAAIGVRHWQSKETAVERLSELGAIAPELSLSDRPRLRDECRRAWSEIREGDDELSDAMTLAVSRHGQLETIVGDAENPTHVVVTEDAQRADARILAEAGYAVLDVGGIPVDEIAGKLEATRGFSAQLIEGDGVRLLVDGEPFVASASDDLFTSQGLDWLPELAVIANEVLGERLERGIPSAHIERRMHAIRMRTCGRISLLVGGKEVDASADISCWPHEHDTLPTLIVTESLPLTWKTLALELCNPISRLIDTRFRALERPLNQLALRLPSDQLERPGDGVLALALGCGRQTVEEHRLALQSDSGRVLDMLVPVVGYYGGVELATALRADAERIGVRFDPAKWLEVNLIGSVWSPEELLTACEQAGDRRELRKALDIEFASFNQTLVELGEAPITNEDELRQLYGAYLARISGDIQDRLRRRYLNDYRTGGDLSAYIEHKSLAFLPFNADWIVSREDIDMDVVESYVLLLLEETLGPDVEISLRARNRVVEANRKSLRGFVGEALSVVRVWCRRNDVVVPVPWRQDEAQSLVREIEAGGLFDFEVIPLENMANLCARAGFWPEGMPKTVDRGELGLEATEVEEEERRRVQERRQIEIARRTIEFGGTPLDTGDGGFAEKLKEIADEALSTDESWFKRSSNRVRLVEFTTPEGSGGGGKAGAGKGGSGRRRQLTDAQRSAMGVASELLALEYLRRRHPDYVDETCWVSENRVNFFGGDDGDDGAGYDFLVRTPQADWLYEVKSTLENSGEFELTANEMRVASSAFKDGKRRYRVLYVPYVFSPDRWFVLELPNPMGEATRNRFETVGRGAVRFRFEKR